MKQAEKGLSSPDEVTGVFAFLSNCGKLLSQSGAAARKIARDAAEEEDLGSEFPVQIGRAAVSMKEAIVSRLRDYAARSPSTVQVLAQAALLNPRSLNLIQAARVDLPEIVPWISEAEEEIRRRCVELSNEEVGAAVTEAGWDEAWGDVGAGTTASPFDRWRDSIAARRVPLPEGYWTGQLRGEHAIVARIAEPLLTLRGSTRVVEGCFSMVRRAFPPEVCGPAHYSTLRRRALLLALPEFVPDILAAVYPGIA